MQSYQLIIIGGGPGGYTAAIRAAQLGLSTALVENRDLGGTCLNRGCIPTKALLHAAGILREMEELALFGLAAEKPRYDLAGIHQRKAQVVATLRGGVEQLIAANKVALFRGTGSLSDAHTVRVVGDGVDETITGEKIILATGSVPSVIPLPGVQLPGVITSDDLLEGEPVDYRALTIIGGGVIGVEFASYFSALGCQVTILEAADRLLPTMDPEISRSLAMVLKKRGITVLTGAMVAAIEKADAGLVCRYAVKEKPGEAIGDAVLMAVGRRPNTAGLFAGGFSVETERGRILTDENLETSVPGVYAIGDVTARIQLAHFATAQGMHVVHRLAGKVSPVDLSVVPACIYTDPEIASVGMTADEARDAGIPVKSGKFLMAANGKTLIENGERGFIKVVAREADDVVIGAQLFCARATDLVSELSTAIVNGLTLEDMTRVIRPHPTFTEGVTEALEDCDGLALHIAPRRRAK